ncbi:MAG: hypothetical protein ACREEW_09930 [Caulobacteraceae bacterium]
MRHDATDRVSSKPLERFAVWNGPRKPVVVREAEAADANLTDVNGTTANHRAASFGGFDEGAGRRGARIRTLGYGRADLAW